MLSPFLLKLYIATSFKTDIGILNMVYQKAKHNQVHSDGECIYCTFLTRTVAVASKHMT